MHINNKIYISVILPIFNENHDTIEELYCRLTGVLESLKYVYEIIFIDDGSNNGIFDTLKKFHSIDYHIKAIRFKKNFGQMPAFLVGFERAQGNLIVTMDSDLQSFPEEIPKFIDKINQGHDVVSGWRQQRKDPFFFRIIPSFLLNKLLIMKSGTHLHDWLCSFNIIKKEVVFKFLKAYKNNSFFIKPLIASLAINPAEVKISHARRKNTKSRYNFISLIKLFLDYFFNFSSFSRNKQSPLFLISEVLD